MNFCYLQCLENISHTHTHTFGWSAKVGQERAWDSAFFQKVEIHVDDAIAKLNLNPQYKVF